MIYREYRLPEGARGAAFCAWRFVLEPHDPPMLDHSIPPDGTSNLALIVGPDGTAHRTLLGPRLLARTVPVAQGWRYVGLRLRPEAARAVTGQSPVPEANLPLPDDARFDPIYADLAALAASDDNWTRHDGIAAALAGVTDTDRAVATAVDRLNESGGRAPIALLAAAAGLGARQFRRRFVTATGISPKQYASVQRVRRALLLALDDPDWAGVASAAGFADQPHLARDIKERFGAAPRHVAGYLGGIRHILLAPDRFVQDVADAAE